MIVLMPAMAEVWDLILYVLRWKFARVAAACDDAKAWGVCKRKSEVWKLDDR